MKWPLVLLILNVALLVVFVAVLIDNARRITRLEKALRARNEAIASALSNTRPHARAISDDKPAASRISVSRINW